jgi:hypothetical protein
MSKRLSALQARSALRDLLDIHASIAAGEQP